MKGKVLFEDHAKQVIPIREEKGIAAVKIRPSVS